MKIKLSWSAYDRWKKCPHIFNLYHILHEGYEIDRKRNRANTVYGSVIQEIFSRFYNDRLWTKKNCVAFLQKELLPQIWEFVLKNIYVDWDDFNLSAEEVFQSLENDIPAIIGILQEKELYSYEGLQRSEVKLAKRLYDDYFLTGKIDFLLNFKGKRTLLDGKSTKDVNEDQLYFYAILHNIIFGNYPDQIGFLFYRESELKLLDFNISRAEEIEKDIEKLIQMIETLQFDATPSEEKCSSCLFNEICEFRISPK